MCKYQCSPTIVEKEWFGGPLKFSDFKFTLFSQDENTVTLNNKQLFPLTSLTRMDAKKDNTEFFSKFLIQNV